MDMAQVSCSGLSQDMASIVARLKPAGSCPFVMRSWAIMVGRLAPSFSQSAHRVLQNEKSPTFFGRDLQCRSRFAPAPGLEILRRSTDQALGEPGACGEAMRTTIGLEARGSDATVRHTCAQHEHYALIE